MAGKDQQPTAKRRRAVEVIGVVHPLGAGGGRVGQETRWSLRFSFVAWRQKGGPVEERELGVAQPGLTDDELRAGMQAVRPYDVLRVRLRFEDGPDVRGRVHAELTQLLGTDSTDAELNAVADILRKPVGVEHPVFGAFTLDRALNLYEVEVPWAGRPVQLYLNRDGCKDEAELFETAKTLWNGQKAWDKRVRDYAAAELLELKNGSWLGEDEKEFTPTQFKAKMALQSVAISVGGRFDFTFKDGNLFWGHVIQVSGTLEDGPMDAGIAG